MKLGGLWSKPKRESSSAIIYLHGLCGNFYKGSYLSDLAKAANTSGYHFLSIEQRGSYIMFKVGRKKGRKWKRVLMGGAIEKFEDCIYDIDGAIKFLKKAGIKNIILAGHSTGCQKITYYQYKKKDNSVKALILLAPADDYNLNKRTLGRKYKKTMRFIRGNYPKNKDKLIPSTYISQDYSFSRFLSFADLRFPEARIFNYDSNKLKEFSSVKEPILAIFGSKEEHALKPVKKYMEILQKNTNSRKFDYRIIKNANHGFDDKEKELASSVAAWLKTLG